MSVKSNFNGRTRFAFGGGTEDFGTRLGWWERNIYPTDLTDMTVKITTKYHKRPDLIAFDYYGTPTLMWLVLQYNNIIDIEELVVGTELKLPTKSRTFTEILRARSPSLR